MSTLDHLNGGRVGWKHRDRLSRQRGARHGFGGPSPTTIGGSDAADEYMSVVYQLWEASWKTAPCGATSPIVFSADPYKIHRVRHHGQHYQVDAIHLAETVAAADAGADQAGSSTRGRGFAATARRVRLVFGADKRITRDNRSRHPRPWRRRMGAIHATS